MNESRQSPEPAPLGVLSQLWRYPVKSMAAEAVERSEVSWHGVAGDRRWAFLRRDSETNGFPYLTIRDEPRMCLYRAELTEPARPDASSVQVSTPEGTRYAVDDPELAHRLGDGVRLTRLRRGMHDAMPLSLISTATVAELCRRAGVPYEPQRFRPNLLVETTEDRPFTEDEWVGRTLALGSTVLRVDLHDPRCVMINTDPRTSETTPAVLRALADRKARAGVYASVVTPGSVATGDKLVLN
ncbi:MOSC domain-containing protein [Streptomyces sp. XM4193]|uniref:MOSC domain-containing protein n=1 Tax=Streptomyces sp. XM4193 TaxID=2929782 RepID=UPI001FFA9EB1|nr:MOSC N-terminal beta barrel domain-containing protein [Streptomyces sp. XM4193]MCK1796003.1 MOSC domain-containing protein [Streptomyces sp. XM4193]